MMLLSAAAAGLGLGGTLVPPPQPSVPTPAPTPYWDRPSGGHFDMGDDPRALRDPLTMPPPRARSHGYHVFFQNFGGLPFTDRQLGHL